jgi:hypothetical protein
MWGNPLIITDPFCDRRGGDTKVDTCPSESDQSYISNIPDTSFALMNSAITIVMAVLRTVRSGAGFEVC